MNGVELKQSIKRFIAKFLKPLSDKKDKNLSVILNYHSIHPEHRAATRPGDFTKQMEYLSSNFKVISLMDLYEMRMRRKELPERIAVVTFDDGYEDNYKYAFLILKKFGIKATIFVTTGFIEGIVDIAKRDKTYSGLKPLTWAQITEMNEWGITFGSHTHTHPILTHIPFKDAEDEIVKSKEILERKLGRTVATFAFPLGQPKTFNNAIISLLKKHSFKLACSTIWGHDNSATDLFSLHRIRIDTCDTFEDFIDKVNGKWDFIRWIQSIKRLTEVASRKKYFA
jgi:peptidoglycan/xylan/chitin deacetylase (PgdA/CDA1 family)